MELLRNANNLQRELDLKHSVLATFGFKEEMTILWSYSGVIHNMSTSGFLALPIIQQKSKDKHNHKYRDPKAGEQLNTLKRDTGGNNKDKTLKITGRRKVGWIDS